MSLTWITWPPPCPWDNKIKQAIGVKNKMLNIIHFWRNFKRNSMKNNLEDNGKCLKLFLASLKHEMQINVEAITIKCKEVSNQSKRHWITSLRRIRTYKPKRSATPISYRRYPNSFSLKTMSWRYKKFRRRKTCSSWGKSGETLCSTKALTSSYFRASSK